MKIIKVSAVWCSGCLVMNKTWNKLKEAYDFEYEELDYDMDEEYLKRYPMGKKLPIFIFVDENEEEVARITGEYSYDDFVLVMQEVGIINEEDN